MGLLEFGVHNHTCIVHGILLSVEQLDDGILRHEDVLAACWKHEDELSQALGQAFQKFSSDDAVWTAVCQVLRACHVHVRELKQKAGQTGMRGKLVCQVELEVRLAELVAVEWCLPLPYKHKTKGRLHAMPVRRATVPIAPADFRRICSLFQETPVRNT